MKEYVLKWPDSMINFYVFPLPKLNLDLMQGTQVDEVCIATAVKPILKYG